jgi:hypothetical protein
MPRWSTSSDFILVRVVPDESPATVVAAFIRVVTSSGKVGYVETDSIFPIGGEQLCYSKEAGGWKIAGFFGGDPNQ